VVYLIQLDNAYKIGYAKDINKRIKNLAATHIVVNLINYKEGEYKDEKALHKLCSNFRIKNELFEIRDEVLDIFKDYIFYPEEPKTKIIKQNNNTVNLILPDDYTGIVILSDEELSKEINISVKTIKRLNKSLIDKGFLEIQNGVKIFKNL